MFEFLLGLTFWPLALFIVFAAACCICTKVEHIGWAMLVTVVYLGICFLAFGFNIFLWIWGNPIQLIMLCLAYFSVGGAWSVFKWFRYVRSDPIQREVAGLWQKYRGNYPGKSYATFLGSSEFPNDAKASHQSGKISSWIGLWPFSVAGFLFGDLLFDVCSWVYERLSGVYDRISSGAFKEPPTEGGAS